MVVARNCDISTLSIADHEAFAHPRVVPLPNSLIRIQYPSSSPPLAMTSEMTGVGRHEGLRFHFTREAPRALARMLIILPDPRHLLLEATVRSVPIGAVRYVRTPDERRVALHGRPVGVHLVHLWHGNARYERSGGVR